MAYAKYGQATALVGMVYPYVEPPGTNPTYSFVVTDFVDAPNGFVSSATQPVLWDFGDGHTDTVDNHETPVTYAWKSPGVYTLTIRYYENLVPIRKTRVLLVKVGKAVSGDSQYMAQSNLYAIHWRIRVPGEATRLMFWVSPSKGYELPEGEPAFTDEPTFFYNMAKELERLYASTILRFPVPRTEALVDGFYNIDDSEALYAGQMQELVELGRQIKECLAWQYTHEKEDTFPHRLYSLCRELKTQAMATAEGPLIMHAFRPFEFVLPEGKGLRLEQAARLAQFDNEKYTDLTVADRRVLEGQETVEERARRDTTLLWLRGVLPELSVVIHRYFDAIKVPVSTEETPGPHGMAMITFNPGDLTLSVRLYAWADAEGTPPVAAFEVWRQVTVQLAFAADRKGVAPLTADKMYGDQAQAPVRVLSHPEAEALVGQRMPLNEKIVSVNGTYYLLDPTQKALSPVGGGGGQSGAAPLHAYVTIRGGGATIEDWSGSATAIVPLLGNIDTVHNWASPPDEVVTRWNGLMHPPVSTPPALVVEGVDGDYEVSAKQASDGGVVKTLTLGGSTPITVCDVTLGPKDVSEYEVANNDIASTIGTK